MTRERWVILVLSTLLSTVTSLWFADYRFRQGWAEGFNGGCKMCAGTDDSMVAPSRGTEASW